MNPESVEHSGQGTDSSVTWVIQHHVRPDRQQDFEAWLKGIAEESARFRGHEGMTIVRPGDGGPHPEYVVVVRFASYHDLNRWEHSTQRAHWMGLLEPMVLQRPTYRTATGLETWFKLPGHTVVVPPPKYKMAVLVFVALIPLILLVVSLLDLAVRDQPYLAASVELDPDFFVRTMVSTLIVVVLMTWVAMPLLTRLAGRWLYPTR